jgi:DNA-directed RNA polymerase I subunit RPA43
LSREEKEVYQLKAAEEREEVSKALQQLKESGQLNLDVGGVDGDNKEGEHGLVLPVARVRKICRLDPEVRGISKEATLLVAKAAEMFTHKLAKETMVIAQMQNRRKCFPEDVVEVCSLKDPYQFLRDDIKDLFREQKALEKKNAPTSKDKVESKHPSVQGTKSITSYFGSSV